MRKYLSWTLALILIVGAMARDKWSGAAATLTSAEELIALLPASDMIIVIDDPHRLYDLIHQSKAISDIKNAKFFDHIEKFVSAAGIDLTKINLAVFGLQAGGSNAKVGAFVIDGINLDPKRIEAVVTAEKLQFRVITHQGKPIYQVAHTDTTESNNEINKRSNGTAKITTKSKLDEIYFASLGSQRAVAGDLASVKSVLAAQVTQNPKENATLQTVLKETKNTGLLRFALSPTESMRQTLNGQGELFEQLAAVKVIFGAFDLTPAQSFALDAKLRMASKEEATQVETSLKSLLFLGKSFLNSNQNPKIKAMSQQLFDQMTIAVEANDVSVSLTIPKSLLD